MKTFVRVENGMIEAVMECSETPAGDDEWIEYPFPCDIGSPLNVAGRALSDFDSNGNLPPPVPVPPVPGADLYMEEQELLLYLESTDWYVIRNQETGAEIPDQILTDRANARSRISEIRIELQNL